MNMNMYHTSFFYHFGRSINFDFAYKQFFCVLCSLHSMYVLLSPSIIKSYKHHTLFKADTAATLSYLCGRPQTPCALHSAGLK